jgi:hypothetical protein
MAIAIGTTSVLNLIWKVQVPDAATKTFVYFSEPQAPAGYSIFGSAVYVLSGPSTGTDDDRATAWGSVVTGKPSSDPDSPTFPVEPTGYELLWKGTNGSDSASVWAPVPPENYVACGHVIQKGYDPPSTSRISCLHYSEAVRVPVGPLIWSQTNSTQPQYDISVFRVTQLGTIFAVPTLATQAAGLTVFVPSNVAR